jgi:hypothetical protein
MTTANEECATRSISNRRPSRAVAARVRQRIERRGQRPSRLDDVRDPPLLSLAPPDTGDPSLRSRSEVRLDDLEKVHYFF